MGKKTPTCNEYLVHVSVDIEESWHYLYTK